MSHAAAPGRARSFATVALLLLCAGVAAQDDAAQRERIARERAAAEAAFLAQELACQERFAVTACVDEARRVRRNALAELRRQSTAIGEALRKDRAERRRREIQDNLARDVATQRDAASRPVPQPRSVPLERLPSAPRELTLPNRTSPPRAEPRTSAPLPAGVDAARAAEEARHRAEFEARRRDAQAHRDEVRRRNEETAARRTPAAPLPVPAASKPRGARCVAPQLRAPRGPDAGLE